MLFSPYSFLWRQPDSAEALACLAHAFDFSLVSLGPVSSFYLTGPQLTDARVAVRLSTSRCREVAEFVLNQLKLKGFTQFNLRTCAGHTLIQSTKSRRMYDLECYGGYRAAKDIAMLRRAVEIEQDSTLSSSRIFSEAAQQWLQQRQRAFTELGR